jgi:hypothetical protein
MSDLPPPDVMDSTGRLRRLALAFVLGVVAAAIAYTISDRMAEPDQLAATGHYARGAYKFVYYITAMAGGVVFMIALAAQNHLAKKAYRASLDLPSAKLKS